MLGREGVPIVELGLEYPSIVGDNARSRAPEKVKTERHGHFLSEKAIYLNQ